MTFDNIDGICEATSYEQYCLWGQFHNEYGYSWVSSTMGTGKTLGEVDGMPVFISLISHIVNGKKILFIEPTSVVVDWRFIDKYKEENYKDVPSSDANNFINLIR